MTQNHTMKSKFKLHQKDIDGHNRFETIVRMIFLAYYHAKEKWNGLFVISRHNDSNLKFQFSQNQSQQVSSRDRIKQTYDSSRKPIAKLQVARNYMNAKTRTLSSVNC